jgi:hypothetical protein
LKHKNLEDSVIYNCTALSFLQVLVLSTIHTFSFWHALWHHLHLEYTLYRICQTMFQNTDPPVVLAHHVVHTRPARMALALECKARKVASAPRTIADAHIDGVCCVAHMIEWELFPAESGRSRQMKSLSC